MDHVEIFRSRQHLGHGGAHVILVAVRFAALEGLGEVQLGHGMKLRVRETIPRSEERDILATRDEISDVQSLPLWLDVNGTRVQQGNTNDMIFGVAFLVSYVSQFMSLLPGDVISTGTPAGVGLGFKPPRFLRAGDLVELGIEGLGRSRQKVLAPR